MNDENIGAVFFRVVLVFFSGGCGVVGAFLLSQQMAENWGLREDIGGIIGLLLGIAASAIPLHYISESELKDKQIKKLTAELARKK